MAKAENKTRPTGEDVRHYLASVQPERRRLDALELLALFEQVTGLRPVLWGTMVGYGRYEYKYESGREGEFFMTGFAPRKANMVVYIMPGYRDLGEKLDRLGKHRIGKSCLYINKLSDIDLDLLREIVAEGVAYMKANYPTHPE
jgi:hypothetical protein